METHAAHEDVAQPGDRSQVGFGALIIAGVAIGTAALLGIAAWAWFRM